jgi:V/A-type H+/Na+-transporting ATPase subunit C
MSEFRELRKPGFDTRYAYAVGRIRAREARLISPADMQRLLDEETQQEVLRTLSEFPDYAAILSAGELPPEEILEEELRQAYTTVSQLSLGSRAIQSLRLKYDYHNLKLLLKAKLLDTEPNGFSAVAFFSREQLEQIVKDKTADMSAGRFVGETIRAAVTLVNEVAAPDTVDRILDRHYYAVFLKSLSVNPFLEEYARRTIDLLNLRMFWRVQAMGWPEERLAESLLPGGLLDDSFFLEEFATPIADFVPRVKDGVYRRILQEALHANQGRGDLALLDKLADDCLIQFLQRTKYYCFGLEPLVGYLAAKENEVMRLRTILFGKEKGIPADAMQEITRISYA